MAWRVSKQGLKAKTVKRPHKITGWKQLGLAVPSKERPATPMDEIRRQGMILASRGIGQAARPQPAGPGVQKTNTGPRPAADRLRRRGATR